MAFAPIGNPIWNVKLHIEKIDEKGMWSHSPYLPQQWGVCLLFISLGHFTVVLSDEAGAGEGELYVDHIGGTMAYVEDSEQTAAGFGSGYGWRSRDRVKPIDGLGLAIVGRADDNVKVSRLWERPRRSVSCVTLVRSVASKLTCAWSRRRLEIS